MKKAWIVIAAAIFFSLVPLFGQESRLKDIQLPQGFAIEVYADDIPTARGLDFAPDGTLFVGSKNGGVYAVLPGDRRLIRIDRDLAMPVGVDYYEGDLYVSAISRILVYRNVLQRLGPRGYEGEAELLTDQFPSDRSHGWKFIKIGPDGMLYVPVGAPCNVCDPANPIYSTITRTDLQGGEAEIVAAGVRNTVGFDWDPWSGELWFTDNGRDWLGDTRPPDELNRLNRDGAHFGFPFLHGKDIRDPEFWARRPENLDFQLPEIELPAHVAALGMRFYDEQMFPEEYVGDIFIAEHGSWNRSDKIGYRISRVEIERSGTKLVAGEYTIFASGWLQGQSAWGRPADVEVGPDGALYVSDDQADMVYRIFYRGE